MTISTWKPPAWTNEVPAGVSFDEESRLLLKFIAQGKVAGFRTVPEESLDFDAREYADLVLEREKDGARLMFALSLKAPEAAPRLDVNARPYPRHIQLRFMEDEWRIVTDSRILDPRPVEELGLGGLARILLDERV